MKNDFAAEENNVIVRRRPALPSGCRRDDRALLLSNGRWKQT
jgi:hypothetical protein